MLRKFSNLFLGVSIGPYQIITESGLRIYETDKIDAGYMYSIYVYLKRKISQWSKRKYKRKKNNKEVKGDNKLCRKNAKDF